MKSTTKNNLLKVLLIVLCLAMASFLGLSLTKTNKANASDTFFKMEYGASIRYTEGSTGIRFRAAVDEDTYEEVMADPDKNFGMLIVPEVMLTNANITSDYVANLKTAYPSQTLGLVDIEGTRAFTKEGNAYKFAGVLSNVRYNNLNRDFFGIAYIKTVDGDTATYEYATYKKTENVRNVVFVASNVINNETSLTASQTTILRTFISDGVKKASGLTQQDEVPELNATLFGTENLTDMFVGQKAKLSAVITRTVNGIEEELKSSVKFTFTSSDESVVKVGIDGTVTAVGGGNATITASNVFLGNEKNIVVNVSVETPAPKIAINNFDENFYTAENWAGMPDDSSNAATKNGVKLYFTNANIGYNLGYTANAHYTYNLKSNPNGATWGWSQRFRASSNYNSGTSYYEFALNDSRDTLTLKRVANGSTTDLGSSLTSANGYTENEYHRVDVVFTDTDNSTTIKIYLDETLIITGVDNGSKLTGNYFQVKVWTRDMSIKPIEEDTETRIKVACVGDSTTYGQGGASPYPTILQNLLGDEDYVVENFGVNSTTLIPTNVGWVGQYTDTSSYTSAISYAPDIVVINFGLNDANYIVWGTENGTGARGKAQAYYDCYVAMINAFRSANPNVRVIVCTPSQTFDASEPHYSARGVNVDYAIIPTITDVCFYNGCELADINGATKGLSSSATVEGLHYYDYTVFAETVYDIIANEPEYLYAASNFIINEYESLYTYYDITLNSPENGSVSVDKDVVEAGEDVVITITPDEGYVLSAITVNGVSKISEVENDTLTISDISADITVNVTFGTEVAPEPTLDVITDADFFNASGWGQNFGGPSNDGTTLNIAIGQVVYKNVNTLEGEYRFDLRTSDNFYLGFGSSYINWTTEWGNGNAIGIRFTDNTLSINQNGANGSNVATITGVSNPNSNYYTYDFKFFVSENKVDMTLTISNGNTTLYSTELTFNTIPNGTYVILECYSNSSNSASIKPAN